MQFSDVYQELSNQVAQLWPSYSGRPIVRFDLSKGTFWTDIVLKVSRSCRISPAQVAGELSKVLPQTDLSIESHYLHFKCDADRMNVYEPVSDTTLSVVVAPNSQSVSALARARLLANAYIQLSLARNYDVSTCLSLGTPLAEWDEDVDWSQLWSTIAQQTNVAEDEFLQYIQTLKEKNERTQLWLSPRSVSHKRFVNLCAKNDPAVDLLWACCPEQNWLQHHGAPSFASFGTFSLSKLCYLASEIRAMDLDPSVPSLGEASNLIWFLESLKSRFESFSFQSVGDWPSNADLADLKKLMDLRSLFERNAVFFGDIREYVAYCKHIAQRINLVCNSPGLRTQLHEGHVSVRDRDIIKFVGSFISQLLEVWE